MATIWSTRVDLTPIRYISDDRRYRVRRRASRFDQEIDAANVSRDIWQYAATPCSRCTGRAPAQQPNRGLAMIAREATERIQQRPFLAFPRELVAWTERCGVLENALTGHTCPPSLGNPTYEATLSRSIAILMRHIGLLTFAHRVITLAKLPVRLKVGHATKETSR